MQPPMKKRKTRQDSTTPDSPKSKSSPLTIKQILAKMRDMQSRAQIVQKREEKNGPSNTNGAELGTSSLEYECKNLHQMHHVDQ